MTTYDAMIDAEYQDRLSVYEGEPSCPLCGEPGDGDLCYTCKVDSGEEPCPPTEDNDFDREREEALEPWWNQED